MSTPDDGANPPSTPPPPPPPPAPPTPPSAPSVPSPPGAVPPTGFDGAPPAYGESPASKNSLPVVSLIFGILGFLCIPIIGGVIAIITGFMGRSRAIADGGARKGMATWGIVLGFISIAWSIVWIIILSVTLVFVAALLPTVVVGTDPINARNAAESYAAVNGNNFEGVTAADLKSYGYVPTDGVTTTIVPGVGEPCIQATYEGTTLHTPGTGATVTVNNSIYTFGNGACP